VKKAMKKSRYFGPALLLLSVALSALARDNPEYDECLLTHLKEAKLDVASQMITKACFENYVDDNFRRKRELRRNDCLLQHLPGIESMDAVARVIEVCDRQSKNDN